MTNREFVQLAHNYEPEKHYIMNWYMSEKLDGMRAIWDGGISRNKWCEDLPWANTTKDKTRRMATGLWSRYGKPIYAPNWFLDGLPNHPLDGELYMGKGTFQELMSTVKQHVPDARWKDVQYYVFDIPSYEEWLKDGRINNPQFSKIFYNIKKPNGRCIQFRDFVNGTIDRCPSYVVKHSQELISDIEQVHCAMDRVISSGGEGLIVRNPASIWVPKRVTALLKIKRWLDSEGTVVGFQDGVGKLEGLVGSVRISWFGKEFNLSGFTDAERVPGYFSIGDTLTFKYRELTNDGLPKEARYFRKLT